MNLDGRKPDNVPQDQWDRMKEVFNEIYEDDNMERLTNEQFSCMRDFCSHTECELYADCPAIAKHNRLCAYEDTGLTPEQVAAQKWIPVSERLPEIVSTHKRYRSTTRKSIRVLCVCVQKSGKTMVKEGYCEWYNDYPEPRWQIPGTIDSVTHWMPLPMPPEEG